MGSTTTAWPGLAWNGGGPAARLECQQRQGPAGRASTPPERKRGHGCLRRQGGRLHGSGLSALRIQELGGTPASLEGRAPGTEKRRAGSNRPRSLTGHCLPSSDQAATGLGKVTASRPTSGRWLASGCCLTGPHFSSSTGRQRICGLFPACRPGATAARVQKPSAYLASGTLGFDSPLWRRFDFFSPSGV
jgi:hypothetical protein